MVIGCAHLKTSIHLHLSFNLLLNVHVALTAITNLANWACKLLSDRQQELQVDTSTGEVPGDHGVAKEMSE